MQTQTQMETEPDSYRMHVGGDGVIEEQQFFDYC